MHFLGGLTLPAGAKSWGKLSVNDIAFLLFFWNTWQLGSIVAHWLALLAHSKRVLLSKAGRALFSGSSGFSCRNKTKHTCLLPPLSGQAALTKEILNLKNFKKNQESNIYLSSWVFPLSSMTGDQKNKAADTSSSKWASSRGWRLIRRSRPRSSPKGNQLQWFRHWIGLPPEHLLGEGFQTVPTRRRLWSTSRTLGRHYVSQSVWEGLSSREELEEAAE